MIDLLFQAVAATLLEFGNGPKSRLNGQLGFTLVLQTWNQQLLDHFHLHCVIPAGALSMDGQSWISSKHKHYLFCVKALSKVFRGKYLALFRRACEENKISFPYQMANLQEPKCFDDFILALNTQKWVVYSKAPFGGPEGVLEYLGRYTHRVAISNHRIINVTDDDATFTYRDRKQKDQKKEMTVTGEEFIRRFLLHTIPGGFIRIRHYGFLASRKKKAALDLIRIALKTEKPPVVTIKELPLPERILLLVGIDIRQCPRCKTGRMMIVSPVPIEQNTVLKNVISSPSNTS
jgi:hypothetical protein